MTVWVLIIATSLSAGQPELEALIGSEAFATRDLCETKLRHIEATIGVNQDLGPHRPTCRMLALRSAAHD